MARRDDKLFCTKEPYIEDIGPRKIKSIKFSTFSGPEIEKVAEVQVWNGRLYGEKMKPVENGLLDLRMGPGNKAGSCATCYGSFTDCPGHFGYLKLTLPVFNVGYFTTILNILKCVCKSCARVLLPEKERLEYLKKMRNPKIEIPQKVLYFKKIRDKCKASRCLRCGYVNGIAKKARSSLTIIEDFAKNWDASGKEVKAALSHIKEKMNSIHPLHVLSPNKVLDLFRRMVDEDCELLCLSDRPEKLIITDIPVPPAGIRPSVFVDFGKSSNEDGITSILKNIVNTNSILREDLENSAATHKCLECWDVLQVQVAEFINSEHSCVPDSKNRGFVQRLKGKHGRFRANLSGKRVEFTGRTVISPDPNLKITEVAIPILMARILTYPERVSQHNIEKLRQCIKNGPFKYPGANYVSLPDGTRLHLKYVERKNVANELKCGYVVERHLENGDIVLFNRQPSLHRMSIMSHRARIMNWRTLRFNESVCNPYNADFDGDEMNMHVPQTEEARTEALMLMGVQNNLCTPKNGEILVASTQDFLTSSFLITRKDTFYDRASFSLICSYMGDSMEHIDLPTPSIIKPLELWTGKQIFSVLVRPNAQTRVFLNLKNPEKGYKSGESMDLDDRFVYFRNSELLSGQIGKSTIGNGSTKGLFSILIRDYGAHAAASCMNRLAKLSARWIGNHGFSIGIDDVTPGEQLNNKRKDAIEKGYEKCNDLILKYNKGDLPLQPGCDAAQTLEALISGVLNKIREDVGKVCMTELHWRNSPLIMSQCGSKGSPINISQMIACVGQQSVGGRRAPDGFIGRTLPHFHRNSKTPSAKGFVANSFYCGLTATEFFFHTMGGREGLVDTAVKTADTGYMSRRLIKTLEDLSTYYDQTVRTASGAIIQFVYGEDGLDPAKMEGKDGVAIDFDHMFGKVMATCPSLSRLFTTDIQHATSSPSDVENAKLSPSEVEQIALDICSKADKIPRSFKQKISEYVETIARALMINKQSVEDGSKKDENIVERTNGRINGISRKQLQLFLEMCFLRYHSKEIEPGAAVGAIGAQSIGEPGTQMTLKTFHFAGVASMNVTLGVPRIKEILDASKNISTPIITATLEHEKDVNVARVVKGSIEKTLLGEVSKGIKVVLKSSQPYISVVLDMDLIEALFMGISSYSVKQSILDDAKIKKCKLKNEHIQTSTICKLKITIPGEKDIQTELRTLQSILPKVIVKGIPSVERAIISTEGGNYKLFIEGTPRGADMGTLRAVMGIPGIKGTETKSNHIIEIQHTLGIEAARKCIIDEIKYTISQYGMNIDIRHMMLLADVMTCKGEVLGTTRYGLKKMKDSVLMLASFEKTEEHLFNASINGREDQIEGVSECIIMGTPMQFGTGILKVIQRVDQLPELKYGADPIFSR